MKELKKYTYFDVIFTSCKHTWYRKKEADIFMTIQNGKISALQADLEALESRLELCHKNLKATHKDSAYSNATIFTLRKSNRLIMLGLSLSFVINWCFFLYEVLQ